RHLRVTPPPRGARYARGVFADPDPPPSSRGAPREREGGREGPGRYRSTPATALKGTPGGGVARQGKASPAPGRAPSARRAPPLPTGCTRAPAGGLRPSSPPPSPPPPAAVLFQTELARGLAHARPGGGSRPSSAPGGLRALACPVPALRGPARRPFTSPPHPTPVTRCSGFEDQQLELVEPSGWIHVPLTDTHKKPIRTFMIQIAVLANHQNGRDTHMRQIKVYTPVEESSIGKFPRCTTIDFMMYRSIR
uniref:Anaphase-promoting complex subunit 10 n=1 Tax=Aquila chrysaetos chrysaetos TaxID=223781 RepID=A0A663E219_AQUCH